MYEARIPTVFEQRYERCTSDQDFVDHEQSPEATVIAGAVVIVVVNRKAHQERNRSKSLAGRVAAVLYTESVSARPSGTPPARLLHAYRSGNSGASRLAHLTSTAPEPRKSFIRRRQPASRTRRNTPRHVRNMGASCVLTHAETGTQRSNGLYNGALESGRLGSGCSVVGVMDEVMSSGGVRAGCEAGCLFLEWQQWRVPSADQSCTTDTTETHAGGAGQSCQRCCAACAHQT